MAAEAVVEEEAGHLGAELDEGETLDPSSQPALPLGTRLEAFGLRVVNEEQVATLAEVRTGHMARHARGPVELWVEPRAALR